MDDKYKNIACSFYDQLEAFATLKKDVKITFSENEKSKTVTSKIVDFETKDKQEFMILEDGSKIRLDKLITVSENI